MQNMKKIAPFMHFILKKYSLDIFEILGYARGQYPLDFLKILSNERFSKNEKNIKKCPLHV